MADKPKTITVTSGLGNNDVALWEKHPKHPDDEIYVAGDAEVEAAETSRVMQAIAEGRLVKVEAKKSAAASKDSK
jgi:hypothetical protein